MAASHHILRAMQVRMITMPAGSYFGLCLVSCHQRKNVTHLKDVDGGLVDGADDGAPCVDGVAHGAHHDCGRPCIQPARGLVLHTHSCQLASALQREIKLTLLPQTLE